MVLAHGGRFDPRTAEAAELPKSINDKDFWRLVTDLSEAGGVFPLQFMSNEDSAQFVIPKPSAQEASRSTRQASRTVDPTKTDQAKSTSRSRLTAWSSNPVT